MNTWYTGIGAVGGRGHTQKLGAFSIARDSLEGSLYTYIYSTRLLHRCMLHVPCLAQASAGQPLLYLPYLASQEAAQIAKHSAPPFAR
jgi:hypothetical protein